MWLIIISISSFFIGLVSFRLSFSKRVRIDICVPIVLTILIVVLPGLINRDKYELVWRLMSVVPALFCGISSAFLSEIPIALVSKYRRSKRGRAKRLD